MRKGRVYVVGTCDTKGDELVYVKTIIEADGVPAILVDLSTRDGSQEADVVAATVAGFHPKGAEAVFTGDRGSAVAEMAVAFRHFVERRPDDIAGMIGLGGSGGSALVAPAMRALAIGVPKLLVSTVASGNVAPYVGPTDMAMMYSVTDMAGLNRISRIILANAAHAVAAMAKAPLPHSATDKPALGISMFGVTTPCVNQLVSRLSDQYECLVFHATGTGGQSMEKLADSRLVSALVDVTTTEVCDLLMGGVFPCTDDRFGAVARTRLPYVGSCGALDMVNFGAPETVPERYRDRRFYRHNPNVTLMRTTAEENVTIGRWIGERLNQCEGEVRFLIPEKGVSAIDAPGQPFHDPAADAALFGALEATLVPTERRRLLRLPYHINDPEFAEALVGNLRDIQPGA